MMRRFRLLPLLLLIPALTHAQTEPGSEPKKPEPAKHECRTVHLTYEAADAKAAYIEVTPEKTSPGTYFCALAFDRGYLGIQDVGDKKQIVVFNTWEAQDASKVATEGETENEEPEAPHVELLEKGESVDGSGGVSRMKFHWEIGKPTKFFVQMKPDGDFTDFTAHLFDPAKNTWRLLATFRVHGKDVPLQRLYSFVEDFRRTTESSKMIRRASYTNGWMLGMDDKWQPLTTARFTAEKDLPCVSVDAGVVPGGFFLQTGGATENKGTKLWQKATRESKGGRPEVLDELIRH